MKTRSNSTLAYLLMLAIGLLVILGTPGFTLAPQQEVPKPVQPPKPKFNAPSHELKSIIPVEPKATIPENIEVEVIEEIEVDPVINEDLKKDLQMDLDLDLDWDIHPSLEENFKSFENFDHNFSFQFENDKFFLLQDTLLKKFEINIEDRFKEKFNYVFSFQNGDSNKIRSRSIIINNNEKKVIIENGEVKELWIDGKQIPDDEIKNHNVVIEDNHPRIRFHEDAQGRLREAEIRAKEAEIRAKEAQARAERRREEIEIRRAEIDSRRREAESRRLDSEERRKESEIRRMEADKKRAEAENFNKLLEENLIKDKLIDNAQNYSLELNNEELKINDEKQPEKIYKKYKNLYEKETGQSLNESSNFIIRKR